jgi:AAA+ ATPase superfamily predicted ATPase
MANPFKYGTVVSGEDFADREEELRALTSRLKETVRIFMVAPRRYGKTSLIRNVLDHLQKQNMLTSYVDLYWATSATEFMELYGTSAIRGSQSISKRAAHFVKEFLPGLRPRLAFDQGGNPELSLDLSGKSQAADMEEVLNLPEQIARSKGKRFVVVLDEFQEILRLDGEGMERRFRAAIQNHTHVSYLFAGSKSHMLMDMVSEITRPFYQMGTLMTLDKIPQEEFSEFIRAKFAKSGRRISSEAVSRIFLESENVPHYVQILSFYVWDHYQHLKQLDEEHVAEALSLILRGQEPAYLTIWEGLTLHQRKTAKAAAMRKGQMLTSKETIRNFRLESASNVAKSLTALCTKGILRKEQEGYVFEDVLFCRWVEKKMEQGLMGRVL